MRKAAPCLRAESHEAGNQFGVDPIRFGSGATTDGKCLDLCGRQLPGGDAGVIQNCPEKPLLSTGGFEANQSASITREIRQLRVADCRIRQPKPVIIR
jgi:hypothetical protein